MLKKRMKIAENKLFFIEREAEATEMRRKNIKPDPTHWSVN